MFCQPLGSIENGNSAVDYSFFQRVVIRRWSWQQCAVWLSCWWQRWSLLLSSSTSNEVSRCWMIACIQTFLYKACAVSLTSLTDYWIVLPTVPVMFHVFIWKRQRLKTITYSHNLCTWNSQFQ